MLKHMVVDVGSLSYWKLFAIGSHAQMESTGLSKDILLAKESEAGFRGWEYTMKLEILHLISKFNPDLLTLACDGSNLWRKDIYPDYKANRQASRAAIPIDWKAFGIARNKFVTEVEKYVPCKSILIPKVEADDIVAVLTKKLHQTQEIIAITGDKDWYQLMKYPNFRVFKHIEKTEVTGVDPDKLLQLKILMGDAGDNIKNLKPRLGEKTALKILNECNGNIYEWCRQENLLENFELNQRLINLDRIPSEIENLIWSEYENKTVVDVDHMALSDYYREDYDIIAGLTFTNIFGNMSVKNLGW